MPGKITKTPDAEQMKEAAPEPMRRNFVIKATCLVVLTIVTTVTVVLLRISRTVPTGELYISSTAIVVTEVLKVVTCVAIVFFSSGYDAHKTWDVVKTDVLLNWKETSKLFLPSALYVLQNNFLFTALSHLNAAYYQVTYQLKILTTAVFSYYMLGKQLHPLQWISLFVLMVGVALLQLDPSTVAQDVKRPESSTLIGVLCVLAASLSSGLAGVYFEKLLKSGGGKQPSTALTVRNIQMGVASIFFGIVAAGCNDFQQIVDRGVFAGYNFLTWIVIVLQAFGGLVVAVTIKYADNILKGFATSFSIILSSVCSYVFLGDLTLSVLFVAGTALVIAATFMYGLRSPAPSAAPRTPDPKKVRRSASFS